MLNLITFAAFSFVAAANPLSPRKSVGTASIINWCTKPAYVHSVGSIISEAYLISPNGGTYSEQYRLDPKSGGIALKVTTTEDGIFTGAPETDFSYSIDGNGFIWYNLNDVRGDAFKGNALLVGVTDLNCPRVEWEDGTPGDTRVKQCSSTASIALTLCD